MQNMMFPSANIEETTRESFAAFQQNPLNRFKVNVRRTRGAQCRQLLSNPDTIDLQTFLHEVWNIESKTHLHSHNIDLQIFENPLFLRTVQSNCLTRTSLR